MMTIKHSSHSHPIFIFLKVSLFVILEVRERAPSSPIELIHNPFQNIEADIANDQSQLSTVAILPTEAEEAGKKLIQTETIQTGSVSCIVTYYLFSNIMLLI